MFNDKAIQKKREISKITKAMADVSPVSLTTSLPSGFLNIIISAQEKKS